MGFTELLTIVLVIAKLTGYFHYGWLAVFAPMLVVYGVILGGVILACVMASLAK